MKLKKFDLENKPCCWFLRSAYKYCDDIVGFVFNTGKVSYDYINYDYAVTQVCITI